MTVQAQPTETQACEDCDFVEWHQGCPWCAVWVLRVDVPQLEQWVASARGAMAPWLLPRYARQPHVTVAYRGLMDGPVAHCAAEFGALQWQQDVQTLQAAATAPWVLQLGGVGSFSTVPYIGVMLDGTLQHVQRVLAASQDEQGWQYVPHVTLGHFSQQVPMTQVMQPLRDCGVGDAILQIPVEALWLARYRTEDIAGPLHFEGCFDLRTQTYQAQPGALLVA